MSRTVDALEALRQILSDHEHAGQGGVRVTPVIVSEDSIALRSVMSSVFRHAGGIFLEAEEAVEGVPGAPVEGLRLRIENVVEVRGPAGELVGPSVLEGDSGVVVRLPNQRAVPEDPGQQAFLGALGALFHEEIRTHAIAGVVYRESEMQVDARRELWDFMTGQLQDEDLGELRTLVVFVSSPVVDYPLHCASDVSAQYIIEDDRVVRRQMREANRIDARRIATSDAPLTVFFLGAGFSASSRLPLGNQLRDSALRRLLPDVEEPDHLPGSFYDYVVQEGRLLPSEEDKVRDELVRTLTLERVLAEEILVHRNISRSPTLDEFEDAHAEALEHPGLAVRKLQSMIRSRGDRRIVLVTVNFDELLEDSLDDGELWVAMNDDELERACNAIEEHVDGDGPVPYLKLHGTIRSRSSIQASIDQTWSGLSMQKIEAIRCLRGRVGEISPNWIYVGYSMRDVDLSPELSSPGHGHQTEEYWVAPIIDRSVERFAEHFRVGIWSQEGRDERLSARTISETADGFFSMMEDFWG